jgi:hypothetical protein
MSALRTDHAGIQALMPDTRALLAIVRWQLQLIRWYFASALPLSVLDAEKHHRVRHLDRAAPRSSNNKASKCDVEMLQTKKGIHWYHRFADQFVYREIDHIEDDKY